jgi:hypothetical protein
MNLKRTIAVVTVTLLVGLGLVATYFVVSVAVLSWTWSAGDIPHKSDEELISNFKAHEAQFNQLLEMVMADKGLHRVDDDWTDPKDPQTIGIPNERIAAYRKIFRALDIPRGFTANQDVGIVKFISSAQGLAVSGSSKAYVWLKKPPTNLVDSIDNYKSTPGASYPVYRHIQGNWYLVFDAD